MSNTGLTVIVPARHELFLKNTILEVVNKAHGPVECLAVLDGYDIPEEEVVKDPRVRYIKRPYHKELTKRHAINDAVKQASFDHIMALDAHCLLGEGYDVILQRDCQDNWVMIPRREKLDAENWKIYRGENNELLPTDYEYYMWQLIIRAMKGDPTGGLHGWRWNERTIERKDIMVDRNPAFQGSCWFLHKDWFNELGLMQTEGYTGWGQESENITFETVKNNGEIMTTKNTYYGHLYKGHKYGRMYKTPEGAIHAADLYHFNLFVNKNRKLFIKFIESFPLFPSWPENWKELLPKI
jgi:glycosyltransferase involved in cell wall biosynthesis